MVKAPSDEQINEDQDHLVQRSIRLHPDIIAIIEKEARAERKKFSAAIRDFLLEGMKARGIKIDEPI